MKEKQIEMLTDLFESELNKIIKSRWFWRTKRRKKVKKFVEEHIDDLIYLQKNFAEYHDMLKFSMRSKATLFYLTVLKNKSFSRDNKMKILEEIPNIIFSGLKLLA